MANVTENVTPSPQIEGTPNPQISGDTGEQSLGQASEESVNLKAILASPEFEEFIEKKVQSKSDKRLGQYGTRLESLEDAISQYQSLIDAGMSGPEAKAQMQGEQTLASLKAEIDALKGNVTIGSSAGVEPKTWEDSQQSILSQHKLENTDPRAVELARSKVWKSHKEYLDALSVQANEWSFSDSLKPQPSSSTVAPTTSAVIPQDGDYAGVSTDALGDNMVELLKSPSKHQEEINRIDKELARRATTGE